MAGIQGLGSPAANYGAALISAASGSQGGGAQQVQPGEALSPSQIEQLRRKLQQAIEQAFQQANQGKSLGDVQKSLRQNVSDTLAKYGFSDSDRNSVLGQLDQIFTQGTSPTDVRQQAQQLMQDVVDNLQSGGVAPAVAASPSNVLGQSVDLLG